MVEQPARQDLEARVAQTTVGEMPSVPAPLDPPMTEDRVHVLQERVAVLERRVEAMAEEMRALQMFNQRLQIGFIERLSLLGGPNGAQRVPGIAEP